MTYQLGMTIVYGVGLASVAWLMLYTLSQLVALRERVDELEKKR